MSGQGNQGGQVQGQPQSGQPPQAGALPPPPPPPPLNPHFQLLLARWESDVRSLEKQGWHAQQTAQEFAKLGLSSALLLNGGALLALPPLMQWLTDPGRMQVAVEARWFLFGIISASAAIVVAYINWMWAKGQQYALARKRARELDCEYQGLDVTKDTEYQNAVRRIGRLDWLLNGTQIIAVIAAISAYGCFGNGVFQFIHLASTNAIAPIKTDSISPMKPLPVNKSPA